MSDDAAGSVLRVDDLIDQDISEALLRKACGGLLDDGVTVRIGGEIRRLREHCHVCLLGRCSLRVLDRLEGDGIDDTEEQTRDQRDDHQLEGILHEAHVKFLVFHFFLRSFPKATGMVADSISGDSMLPMMIE